MRERWLSVAPEQVGLDVQRRPVVWGALFELGIEAFHWEIGHSSVGRPTVVDDEADAGT